MSGPVYLRRVSLGRLTLEAAKYHHRYPLRTSTDRMVWKFAVVYDCRKRGLGESSRDAA